MFWVKYYSPVHTSNFTWAEPNHSVRRMQRSTYESVRFDRFVFGSTRHSIRLRQSNRTIGRQKFDFDSYVELLHMPNQMHTLRINYCKLYLSQRSARSIDLACAKDFILNKMAGKEECACSSCLETTKYTGLRCERFKKKRIYSWCTHALQTDTNFPIQAISKARPQDFSEQNLQKKKFEENITLFKQRLRYNKTLRSQFQRKNVDTTKQTKTAQKHFAVCYGVSPFCA